VSLFAVLKNAVLQWRSSQHVTPLLARPTKVDNLLKSFWHILLIWVLAAFLLRFVHKLVRLFKYQIGGRLTRSHDSRRIDTLSTVFQHAAAIVFVAIAGMLTLDEIGISITPILATAGVAGIAVGFGAQSLVKDFFTGLFLLVENQISEGDLIEAAGKSGIVEEVTLRHVRIRDYDGSVHFIPNGSITIVTNRSREFSYSIIDVNVARHANLTEVFAAIRSVSNEMRSNPLFREEIIEDVEVEGVEKLEESLIVIRCRLKVTPLQQWRLRREFLTRMKTALDALSATKPQEIASVS
jgi:small-conductance mechanosensitive channel